MDVYIYLIDVRVRACCTDGEKSTLFSPKSNFMNIETFCLVSFADKGNFVSCYTLSIWISLLYNVTWISITTSDMTFG